MIFRTASAKTVILLAGWLWAGGISTVASAFSDDSRHSGGLRRPVALVLDETQQRLLVATERDGSISTIELPTLTITGRQVVCERLADLTAIPGQPKWLALDSANNRLLLLDGGDAVFAQAAEVAVPVFPVRVVVTSDGNRACVASLWPRQFTVVNIDAAAKSLTAVPPLALPFPPRELLLFDGDRRLLVADAFGGSLAVVNLESLTVESVRTLRAHNLRGLALAPTGTEVYISLQELNRLARADFEDIHWGNLLHNRIRIIPTEALLDPSADLQKRSRPRSLDSAGNGAGDPGRLLVESDERVIVLLEGAGELAIGSTPNLVRVPVGRRPAAMAITNDGDSIFVANALDDTISVYDRSRLSLPPTQTIALSVERELSPAERGERLFFDARLSHDHWLSCHSCHANGHTIDLTADTLGDGDYGAPKRIPSLLGIADAAPFAWNGSVPDLDAQVQQSVTSTMQGRKLSPEQITDLVSFLRTLSPPPPVNVADDDARTRGRAVFEQRRCMRCHQPPAYTSSEIVDVGLTDESGRSAFNPPSLVGVGQRRTFLHDGRAKSLEEVIRDLQHQIDNPIADAELADLIAFLRSL